MLKSITWKNQHVWIRLNLSKPNDELGANLLRAFLANDVDLAAYFEGTENVIAAHRLSHTAPLFVRGVASRKTTESSK